MPLKDPNKRREYNKEYSERNKEKVKIWKRTWVINNKEKVYTNSRNWWHRLKQEIFELLGTKCSNPNCPIPSEKLDIRALQIDHVRGGGMRHIKNVPRNHYYKSILNEIKAGSKDYQLLCAYCNWMKRFENKEYRHGRGCIATHCVKRRVSLEEPAKIGEQPKNE